VLGSDFLRFEQEHIFSESLPDRIGYLFGIAEC
jgi:hypothetical protein